MPEQSAPGRGKPKKAANAATVMNMGSPTTNGRDPISGREYRCGRPVPREYSWRFKRGAVNAQLAVHSDGD
jgi:hypothetical protein